MALDTHLIVKELINAGASENEAEVLVKRFVAKDEVDLLNSQLATKSDINKLESDISEFKSEIKSEIKVINSSIGWLKLIAIANLGAVISGVVGILFK